MLQRQGWGPWTTVHGPPSPAHQAAAPPTIGRVQKDDRHPGAAGRLADSVPSSAMTDDRQPPPRAVIFDLGGTLVDWPDWNQDAPRRWALSWDALTAALPDA